MTEHQKQEVMSRIFTMGNRLGLTFMRDEIDGFKREKEDAHLLVQEQKRQRIYEGEENLILQM